MDQVVRTELLALTLVDDERKVLKLAKRAGAREWIKSHTDDSADIQKALQEINRCSTETVGRAL